MSKANSPPECPRTRYCIVYKQTSYGLIYKRVKVSCGTWSCPVCSVKKRKLLLKRIRKACPKKDFYLLTLTLRQNEFSLSDNWKYLSYCWGVLLKRLRRKFGKVKYFRCVELQKNGMPHIHALIDCFMSKKEIQKIWEDITGDSFIARFEKVKFSCAGYVAKYLVKSVRDIMEIRDGTGKKTKIYVYSKSLLPVEKWQSDWKLYYFCKVGEDIGKVFDQLIRDTTWHSIGSLGSPGIVRDKELNISEVEFYIMSTLYNDESLKASLRKVSQSPRELSLIRSTQLLFDFSY